MIPQPAGGEGSRLPGGVSGGAGFEGGAQPVHGGFAVISDGVVLLGECPGVWGFDELDRADGVRGVGVPAQGRSMVGAPAGAGYGAVLALRGAR